jgi:aspartyl-tRNA(Asn)/glutamyl-tRNA(Gln) amidotransferase subunit A
VDRYGGFAGTLVPAVDYLQAMRLRARMKQEVARVFASYDAVVSPGRASVAYPADRGFDGVYPGVSGGPALIPAGNLCGLPALCVPVGLGENGLPTSMALMGPAFSEAALVALGVAYQNRTDWHARHPPGVG